MTEHGFGMRLNNMGAMKFDRNALPPGSGSINETFHLSLGNLIFY